MNSAARARALVRSGIEAILLGASFEDDVKGCFGGAANVLESGRLQNPGEPAFSRLRAQSEADFLRQRSGRAEHGRSAIEHAADRIQVVLQLVMREGLDDH